MKPNKNSVPASASDSLGTAAPTLRRLGWVMVSFSLVTSACFGVLSAVFNFPEILREPAAEVLPKFAENATIIRPTYWLLAMTGLVLIGISVELGNVISGSLGRLISGFGAATGIFWALGYARWPITMPLLAQEYQSGNQAQASALYNLLNRYAGMTVGEHLGFISMGVFAAALALGLRRAQIGPRWLIAIGFLAAVSIAGTAYEQYDPSLTVLGAINGAANTVWFLWILALGVVLVRRGRATAV